MRHNLLALTEKNVDFITYDSYSSFGSNQGDIAKMKKVLSAAIKCELTPRQRECIVMYFYDNKKMHDIAFELSLSKSTVSRHIKAGVKKLKNIANYY